MMDFTIVSGNIINNNNVWTLENGLNVDYVSNNTSVIIIDYTTLGVAEIGTFICSVDTNLNGIYEVGASVGLTSAAITISRPNINYLAALITWNGSAFVSNNANVVPTYNTGTGILTLTHLNNVIVGSDVDFWHLPNSIGKETMYEIQEISQTVVKVKLYGMDGSQKNLVSPNTYRFYFERMNGFAETNQNPNNIQGGINFYGTFLIN